MNKIISLGSASRNIANEFKKYNSYEIFTIGKDKANDFIIPSFTRLEDYEEINYNINFFSFDKGTKITFIVCGGSCESAATLKILETLKSCAVSVVYIKPDSATVSKEKRLLDRLVSHVIQEYARSARLASVVLIDNSIIESFKEFYGKLPIIGYYTKINELIASTIHMIDVFENIEPIINHFQEPSSIERISTLGLVDVETGLEKLYYNMANITTQRYYYAINKQRLKDEGDLYVKIRKQVVDREGEPNFSIFETNYNNDYCYSKSYSSIIQTKEIN